jgi:copper chaperone CopZ
MLEFMDERMIRIRIIDLGCVAEVIGLERHLARTLGVLGVTVNPATDTAYIRYDGFTTSPERLRAAILAAGFRAADPVAS